MRSPRRSDDQPIAGASAEGVSERFPLDGPKTLNGLILEHLQAIPEPNTSVKIAGHPLEIVQTHGRVVKAARLMPPAGA